MCGITGFIDTSISTRKCMESTAYTMTGTLNHRGPDSSGIWCAPEAGVALGHTRLAILDLSPLGHQPMHSACGRYTIVYNGEIYNHLSLRPELEQRGCRFKSNSDTETILAAIAEWGLMAVKKFIGMFAFALWDNEKRELSLVRDRMGIKPLYYGFSGKIFLFGSELKALKSHPSFESHIDRDSVATFFRHNYVPAPYSIYEGIRKLPPGTMLTLSQPNIVSHSLPEPDTYWSAYNIWEAGVHAPLQANEGDISNELETLLADAVGIRMLSDVPLGAFLSGGIDSSLVATLMQQASTNPVKTFSIGFENATFNEAPHAKAVARHLGTDHTELYLSTNDVLSTIPEIPTIWDEPFADSSQIPTYCLSKLTREHVTVSLSGDGGDELFAGYKRYSLKNLWNKISCIPMPVRKGLSKLSALPPAFFKILGSIGPKIHWRLDLLTCTSYAEFYRFFLSHHRHPNNFVKGATEHKTPLSGTPAASLGNDLNRMTYWDTAMYLPDDILTKVDRASMAASLEARVPLLDHRVVELAAHIPMQMKIRGTSGKHILKNILYKYVPQTILERPKMGFGIPLQDWLRRDLREWAHELLAPSKLRQQGFLDTCAVEKMWTDFLKGREMLNFQVWDVLVFQAWLEQEKR